MDFWKRAGMAALLLPLLLPLSAYPASLFGNSSTVLEWSDTPEGETAVEAYQYLRLSAKELPGGVDFQVYGRLADDLKNETEPESRLYYGYLDKKDAFDRLDLRFGRQFITTAAGASLLDGIKLDYAGLDPVSLSLYGGGDVSYYEGYSSKDWLSGLAATYAPSETFETSLSYLQRWEDGELGQELLGFDLDYDYRRALNLYGELQYSWLTEETTYFLAGVNYHRERDWNLRGEYLYSLPVFSATSIYSVFAAAKYQEASLEATLRLRNDLNAFIRLSREFYDDFDDAQVIESGIEKLRNGSFSGYLVGSYRDDEEGQDLYGVKARLAYLFHRKFEAAFGAHIDVLERRLDDEDETTSQRLWIDITSYLSDSISLQGKVERIESDLWAEYYQGRVRLTISF
ncbi:MAG: hypothetical protein C0621_03295 [Desulfuromonas sp.]|nr:MAG: hypothetical protein C0621_03295 [Desulfuromonas sp.]